MFDALCRNPQYLAAAAGLISVPIIIHLINRLRFKRIKWAAMEFLLKAQKRNRRRLIIEQLLLLALRCLLVAMVGFMVMKFIGSSFGDIGIKQSLHIVLLDDSLSMNDRWKKGDAYTTCFDVARNDILIKKIAKDLSQAKSNEHLVVLPLSTVSGGIILSQDRTIGEEDPLDDRFGAAGGRIKVVPIELQKDGTYGVRLASKGCKAQLRLVDPAGQVVAEVDGSLENPEAAPELGRWQTGLSYGAVVGGMHKIVVASTDDKPGSFELEVTEERESKVYEKFNVTEEFEKFEKDMAELQPTKLHLNLTDGVRRARKIAEESPKALITFHVLSDFRRRDWGSDESAPLYKELIEFAKQRKAQIKLVDAGLDPSRTTAQGVPPAHDNIGIVDLKPRSRMVGKGMPVTFTLSIANYGPETEVNVDIYRVDTGERQPQIDFIPPLPLKLKPKEITQATFELAFSPDIEDNESYFGAISAHLRGNLDKDGLVADNSVYGVVEVRKQVPVLIVDGEGKAGYEDQRKGRDSFFLTKALDSVPGMARSDDDEGGADTLRPFRIDLPHKMGMIDPMMALERGDPKKPAPPTWPLRQYPVIILANVPSLTDVQLENLEKYVEDGGGLAIFMGPKVDTKFYNKSLYKEGKGIFPMRLKETYYPPESQKRLQPMYHKGVPMLLLRDDDPKLKPLPIFGAIFTNQEQRELLELLPVYRYFQVEPAKVVEKDKEEIRRVFELATLPNEKPIEEYQYEVMDIIRPKEAGKASKLADLLEVPDFSKYAVGFGPYRESLKSLVEKREKRPYFLALELERMLKERGTGGKNSANLEEFWSNADPRVQSLAAEVKSLLYKVRYGDGSPFILASSFGKGKVVTMMSTAGNLWLDWVGGNPATTVYQPFIWEMQNYLSAQGSDVNLSLGKRFDITVDTEAFNKRPLEMVRTFLKEEKEKPAQRKVTKGQGREAGKTHTYSYPSTMEPGVYISELYYQGDWKEPSQDKPVKVKDKDGKDKEKDKEKEKRVRPLMAMASVFNVDVEKESNLERVSHEIIKVNLLDKGDKRIDFIAADEPAVIWTPPTMDFSESPLLFLLILAALVAEQALAVHLSFHLKGNENLVPAGQPRQQARAA